VCSSDLQPTQGQGRGPSTQSDRRWGRTKSSGSSACNPSRRSVLLITVIRFTE
jgi:hypothetical protein